MTDILKNEWGFEGLVVSDWGAVRDRVAALKAGLDWEMPGPQDRRVKAVVDAVRSGELDEAVLDESVRRILRIVFKAKETPKNGTFDVDAHHELAHQIAAEGMVLLKNNGILPLKRPTAYRRDRTRGRKRPLPGRRQFAHQPDQSGSPVQGTASTAGNAELTYAEGYPTDNSFRQDLIDQAVSLAQSADVALLYIALPTFKESEGYDRQDLDLTEQQIALIKAVAKVQPKTVVVLNNGAPVAMSDWIDGVAAVLEALDDGSGGRRGNCRYSSSARSIPAANWPRPSRSNSPIHPRTSTGPAVQARYVTAKVCSSAIAITMPKRCRCCSPSATG